VKQTEIQYCVTDPEGKYRFYTLSHYRKDAVTKFLKLWREDLKKWKSWYRKGWRVRKVLVTVEEIK